MVSKKLSAKNCRQKKWCFVGVAPHYLNSSGRLPRVPSRLWTLSNSLLLPAGIGGSPGVMVLLCPKWPTSPMFTKTVNVMTMKLTTARTNPLHVSIIVGTLLPVVPSATVRLSKLILLTSRLRGGTTMLLMNDEMTPLNVVLTTTLMVTLIIPFPIVKVPNLPTMFTGDPSAIDEAGECSAN